MEELLIGIGVVVFVLLFLWLPIWALVSTRGAKRRISKLEADGEQREKELRYLYERVRLLEARPAAEPTASKAPAPETAPPAAEPSPIPPAAEASDAPTAPVRPAGDVSSPDLASPSAAPAPAAAATPPKRPTAPPPKAPPPKPAEPAPKFEERLGFWLTRVGVVLLLFGALYAFKYAVDNEWIGPAGRVLIGAAVGLGFLVGAEALRKSTRAGYVHALVGVGLACLYIAAYASAAFYHLLPTEVAFITSAAIVLIGGALAWHHRGEAILVLALLATFLNPILLSTGEDRPLALFSYLFVMSAAMVFIAVRLAMVRALFVAVLGVVIVFGGWYDKFFQTFDLRGSGGLDRPPEELVGAYFELSARAVPALFVAIFSIEWIAAGFGLRHKHEKSAVALVLSGLILSHVGFTALFFDHPLVLGAAMIGAGLMAIGALLRLGRSDLLLAPMLAAFALLAAIVGKTPSADQTLMLAMLGGWTLLYVLSFLRAASDRHQNIEPKAAILAAIGLGVFAILAAIVLLGAERPLAFALVLMLVSGLVATLAHRAQRVALATAGVALSVLLLAVAAEISGEQRAPADLGFILTLLGWSAIYIGAIAFGLARGRTLGWPDLITMVAAGLSGLALSIAATGPEVPTLRALIAAGYGAAYLGVAQLATRRPELKAWVSILCALALGLFAASVGFGLSGATITIVWAVLALVAAWIWAESQDPIFGAALLILGVATVLRLVSVDVATAQRLVDQYRWSNGREGLYRLPAMLNPQAYALLGTGLAFLFSAARLARAKKPVAAYRPAAAVLAIGGYGLLIALLVTEISAAILQLPPAPPMVLDFAEFQAFMSTVREAEHAQAGKLGMVSTLILSLVAMGLLAIGFSARDAFHRYLGLAVFMGALLKLVTWDVWHVESVYRTIVFVVLGMLLLAGGYLYSRLKSLFTEGKVALWLIAGLATATASAARADGAAPSVERHRYATLRSVEGVSGPGDYRLPIDLDLYRESLAAERLVDIRLAGPDGSLVPHVLRQVRPVLPPSAREGSIFDPQEMESGGARATFEVPAGDPHCEVTLDLEGPTPYLRRTIVETGERADKVEVVARGGVIYALNTTSEIVRSNRIHYPRSVARWVRITLLPDREAAETRILGAHFSCVPPEAKTPVDPVPIQIVARSQDAEKKRTILDLDVGSEGLPLRALHFETSTPEFVRQVEVAASSYKSVWPPVTSGVIHRVEGTELDPESTAISLPELTKRYLRISIEDGDDAPLTISAISGEILKKEILLRASSGGAHALYVGDSAGSAARYDLGEVLARRAEEAPLMEAHLGAPKPNPDLGKVETPKNLPFTEQHRGVIAAVLGVVLVGLSAWAVLMIRRGNASP